MKEIPGTGVVQSSSCHTFISLWMWCEAASKLWRQDTHIHSHYRAFYTSDWNIPYEHPHTVSQDTKSALLDIIHRRAPVIYLIVSKSESCLFQRVNFHRLRQKVNSLLVAVCFIPGMVPCNSYIRLNMAIKRKFQIAVIHFFCFFALHFRFNLK